MFSSAASVCKVFQSLEQRFTWSKLHTFHCGFFATIRYLLYERVCRCSEEFYRPTKMYQDQTLQEVLFSLFGS